MVDASETFYRSLAADQSGAGRTKFMSRAFLLPKTELIALAHTKGIKGHSTMTVMQLLDALKLTPTYRLINEHAAKFDIPARRADGKAKIIRLIRRLHFTRHGAGPA